MSAVRTLSGVTRTWCGKPNSVANDRQRTCRATAVKRSQSWNWQDQELRVPRMAKFRCFHSLCSEDIAARWRHAPKPQRYRMAAPRKRWLYTSSVRIVSIIRRFFSSAFLPPHRWIGVWTLNPAGATAGRGFFRRRPFEYKASDWGWLRGRLVAPIPPASQGGILRSGDLWYSTTIDAEIWFRCSVWNGPDAAETNFKLCPVRALARRGFSFLRSQSKNPPSISR